MKKKEIRTIVKINAPLAQANEWTRNAKQLKTSRSEYLLNLIDNNSKPRKFFSLETILNKFTKK
jgi:hypothetical protein